MGFIFKNLKEIVKFFFFRAIEGTILIVLFVVLPSIPPYTSISEPYKVTTAIPFEGKLALNRKLDDVEYWHKGDFLGPEAIIDFEGELYVTLHSGDIVKLTGPDHITPIIKTGKPCKPYEEPLCGRPLGLQFDKNGNLYVCDAYYGIFKVNVKTGEKELIVNIDEEINGKKPKLPNSLVLAKNGDIYWTDSSTEFSLENGIFDLLADPSGRLLHYNAKTKKNTVLLDKIHFANGVALSDDEEFVIVAETERSRIHRYYLKGPKTGSHDIFIDGLPGLPDNLKPDGKGGFFIPLVVARDAEHPSFQQVIGPFPWIRKFFARSLAVIELGFVYLNKVFPNVYAAKAIHFIGHFTMLPPALNPSRTTILRVSKTGEIMDSLHCLNKKITAISEVHIFENTLYLGSPFNDYIGKIPLSKVGWDDLKAEKKKRDVPVDEGTTAKPISMEKSKPQKSATVPPQKKDAASTQDSTVKQQIRPPTVQRPPSKLETPSPKPAETSEPISKEVPKTVKQEQKPPPSIEKQTTSSEREASSKSETPTVAKKPAPQQGGSKPILKKPPKEVPQEEQPSPSVEKKTLPSQQETPPNPETPTLAKKGASSAEQQSSKPVVQKAPEVVPQEQPSPSVEKSAPPPQQETAPKPEIPTPDKKPAPSSQPGSCKPMQRKPPKEVPQEEPSPSAERKAPSPQQETAPKSESPPLDKKPASSSQPGSCKPVQRKPPKEVPQEEPSQSVKKEAPPPQQETAPKQETPTPDKKPVPSSQPGSCKPMQRKPPKEVPQEEGTTTTKSEKDQQTKTVPVENAKSSN